MSELEMIMLSGPELLALAAKNPPLPAWFDEEETCPFDDGGAEADEGKMKYRNEF